jgi:diacylglycerol kinase (ATP)
MKAQLIYNPVAGPHDVTNELAGVLAYLESCGWEVTLRKTLGPGDATTYAREAVAQHCDMAVAVGGDGTLGEVVNGLAGSNCTLGTLPVGTGNVWANMIGLPLSPSREHSVLLDAARVLVEGKVHQIDLGKAGERYFLLWTGIGFDAQIAHDIEPYREMRRSLGNLTYFVTAAAVTTVLRGTRMTVVIDGKAMRQRFLLIVVTNAQLYGSSWRLAPQARLDDGLLDVYLFKGSSGLDAWRHYFMILLGKHRHDPKVETYRARRIEIRGAKTMPLHIDGEPTGYTPVTITVVPRALRVIVPAWASGTLFQEGSLETQKQASLARQIAERLRYQRERWQTGSKRYESS